MLWLARFTIGLNMKCPNLVRNVSQKLFHLFSWLKTEKTNWSTLVIHVHWFGRFTLVGQRKGHQNNSKFCPVFIFMLLNRFSLKATCPPYGHRYDGFVFSSRPHQSGPKSCWWLVKSTPLPPTRPALCFGTQSARTLCRSSLLLKWPLVIWCECLPMLL